MKRRDWCCHAGDPDRKVASWSSRHSCTTRRAGLLAVQRARRETSLLPSKKNVSRVLVKVATVLVMTMMLVNTRCLAACLLEPCHVTASHAQPGKADVPPCHQAAGDQQQEQGRDNAACSHEAVASEGAAKVSLPENVAAATAAVPPGSLAPAVRLCRIAVIASSPPLTRVPAFNTILRI